MREGKKIYLVFFETPLATGSQDVIIILVPPYDCFGDWATPKEPAAELFLRPDFPRLPFRDDLLLAKLPAL
jgi:hypothetical protein